MRPPFCRCSRREPQLGVPRLDLHRFFADFGMLTDLAPGRLAMGDPRPLFHVKHPGRVRADRF